MAYESLAPSGCGAPDLAHAWPTNQRERSAEPLALHARTGDAIPRHRLYVRAHGHPGGPSHGQPRTLSAEPPDLRKPAGRTLSPQAHPASANVRQGKDRRTTHRRPLSPRTGDTGSKDCHSGTSNHDDRGTGGSAASCRDPPRRGQRPPARPRHYPPAPDTRTPQADGAPP
jgi:hypothetical protein